jgi:hypothetical protein
MKKLSFKEVRFKGYLCIIPKATLIRDKYGKQNKFNLLKNIHWQLDRQVLDQIPRWLIKQR